MKQKLISTICACAICACAIIPATAAPLQQPTPYIISNEDAVMEESYFKAAISDLPKGREYHQVTYDGYVWIVSGDEAYARYVIDPYPGWTDVPLPGQTWEQMQAKYKTPERMSDCILNVPLKSQGIHNCWAAADAMIISYKTMDAPTASEVCRTVYAFDGDHSGSIDDAVKALSKYGLSSYLYRGLLTFREVQLQIEHDQPIFLTGTTRNTDDTGDVFHAVVLRGFEKLEDGQFRLYFADSASESYTRRLYLEDEFTDPVYIPLGDGRYIRWIETIYNIRPQ